MVSRRSKNILNKTAILFVAVIVVLAISYRIYLNYELRYWNYNGNFAILDIDKLSVTVYVPDREAIYTFLLPQEAYIDVPGGYGTYQVKNVRELSLVETGDGRLLARAITTGIGIPVTITTDKLTIWDKVLMRIASNNYQGRRETFNLSEESIFTYELRADGVDIPIVDTKKLASLLAELLWEKRIINERLTVGVFNASGIPGLASSMSSMLETMGIRVVDTTNWEEDPITGTCLFRALKPVQNSVTLSRLTSVIHCNVEYIDQTEGRFDIKLILNDLPL